MRAIASVVISLLTATAILPRLCSGFPPHFFASVGALAPSTMDHKEITSAAALIVLKKFLLDNPNKEVDSTSVINSLGSPTARDLFAAYYHGKTFCYQWTCTTVGVSYNDAIGAIEDANAAVDTDESALPEAHFDNEQILEGNQRLLVKRQKIHDFIASGSYENARIETGRALHTLQDFYSHSNWVELGKTEPLEDLGRPGRRLANLAGKQDKTCTDCQNGHTVSELLDIIAGRMIEADREYNCRNNLDTNVIAKKLLTTGYYGHTPDYRKPTGKCSHGGVGDLTSDFTPKGGINKDIKANRWSPHFYLHEKAANVAIKATVQFLQDIRKAVKDKAFAAFLSIDFEQSQTSVAFVMDKAVRKPPQVEAFLSKLLQDSKEASFGGGAVDYILVQSSDPGTTKTTQSIATLMRHIKELVATGEDDSPGSSIEALIQAAVQSKRRGAINYFANNAEASNTELLAEATSLISDKDLMVNVFTTGERDRSKRSVGRYQMQDEADTNDIHQFLATISGGLKLDVDPVDLSSVHSIITSSFKPTTLTIFQQTGLAGKHTVEFQVDSTVTEIQLIINGQNPTMEALLFPRETDQNALKPPEPRVSLASISTYVATINTTDSRLFGTWQLTFTTTGPYRVYITGDSRLSFKYSLYRRDNTTRSGYRDVTKKVLQGELLMLLIEIDGEPGQVSVTTVTILSSNGTTLSSTGVTATDNGYYHTSIEAPASTFLVKISGVDSRGYQFTRISRTGVETTDVQVSLGPGQSPLLTLQSGESQTVKLLLSNFGLASTFSVKVASRSNLTGFMYYLYSTESGMTTKQTLTIGEGEKTSLDLIVTVQEDEDSLLYLTVTMSDNNSIKRSSLLTIEATATATPQETPNSGKGLGSALSTGLLFGCLLIAVFL